ncbi:hypothetical protein J7L68_01005 [bacterium]|nr:hypothetical protein [bacterium]
MSFADITLFTTSDILSREGEILENVPFVNRHEVVKSLITDRIHARFPDIDEPEDYIENPEIFCEPAICLNLSLVLRENSTHRDDIYAIRSEFYQRRFEEEIDKALTSIIIEDYSIGVELLR